VAVLTTSVQVVQEEKNRAEVLAELAAAPRPGKSGAASWHGRCSRVPWHAGAHERRSAQGRVAEGRGAMKKTAASVLVLLMTATWLSVAEAASDEQRFNKLIG
jgi:hypothetical protein